MERLSLNSSKVLQLFALLPHRPREFYKRVAAIVDSRLEFYRQSRPRYETLSWEVLLQDLSVLLGADLEAVLCEEELGLVEKDVACGIRALPEDAPFPLFHNGDFGLARLCYMLVRVARPASIVETGVCYGVTSAFLLQALRVNGGGCLHSIDLPPLAKTGDEFVGRLVPQDLRPGWRLHRGRSVDMLPEVARELRQIDFFLHDSLHTYRNMRHEFEIVTPFLAPQAVVVADDVQGNSAFNDWASRAQPSYSGVLQERSKQSLLGLAVWAAQRPLFTPGIAKETAEQPAQSRLPSSIISLGPKGGSPRASSK